MRRRLCCKEVPFYWLSLFFTVAIVLSSNSSIVVQSFSLLVAAPILVRSSRVIPRTTKLALALDSHSHLNQQTEIDNPTERDETQVVTTVAVIGGGISGLVVAHVLQQSKSPLYNVTLLEASATLGGHIRSIPSPHNNNASSVLNVGHATHMGMFVNLRTLLQHFHIPEWPVGQGPNHEPRLFRMLNIGTPSGSRVIPSLHDILHPSIWWQAFWFYTDSYRQPLVSLRDYLARHKYSAKFVSILTWAMKTFEFDKANDDVLSYSVGTARALLVTQVFFQFLLCHAFQGSLPRTINQGLAHDLSKRIGKGIRLNDNNHTSQSQQQQEELQELQDHFHNITQGPVSLASYFTADYNALVQRLADGIGTVKTNTTVSKITKQPPNNAPHSKNPLEITIRNNTHHLTTEETLVVDKIVLTTHPMIAAQLLDPQDFEHEYKALATMASPQCTGAVGVRIVHAQQLPFVYPPPLSSSLSSSGNTHKNRKNQQNRHPPQQHSKETKEPILGIFDISQLTRDATTGLPVSSNNDDDDDVIITTRNGIDPEDDSSRQQQDRGGWLSIAYPVPFPPNYTNALSDNDNDMTVTRINAHEQWFDQYNISHLDKAIYPWTKATPLFFQQQQTLQLSCQGTSNGIYITGQALTGVNKASELQVTNALKLCRDSFGIDHPPWRYAFWYPMLPDCNDCDATVQAKSIVEAMALAFKSLVGSFLLTAAVDKLGTKFFD